MKPHEDGGVTFESVAEVNVLVTGLRAMEHVSTLACMSSIRDGARDMLKSIRRARGAKARQPKNKTAVEFLRRAAPTTVTFDGLYDGTFVAGAVEVVATAPEVLVDFPELVDPLRSEAATIMIEGYRAAKAAGNFYTPTMQRAR
jgi:hypothetical protein